MRHVETIAELRVALEIARKTGAAVRFVPTMGALHEGHASLVRAARADGGFVVMSLYVNPTQFGPNEDFARYPRTPDADRRLGTEAGADLIWTARDNEMYPAGESIRLHVGALGDILCGAYRPGHFDGVATIVAKLLAATSADTLYLGEKDFQQTVVVRRMISDLLLSVRVVVVPTVRDATGLALSSRNRYLSPDERLVALAIPRALASTAVTARAGEDVRATTNALRAALASEPRLHVQYAEIRDSSSLEVPDRLGPGARAFVAAYVGSTRLIDNRLLLP
jgi:pantoate--beta-alanine ligase